MAKTATTASVKRNKFTITASMFGVCELSGFTYISDPDTKGQYADNKYKCIVRPSPENLAKVIKIMREKAKEWGVKPKMPIRNADNKGQVTDEDGNDVFIKADEAVGIYMTSKNRPGIFDTSKPAKPLPAGIKVYSGSKVRPQATLTHSEKGLNLWLDAVQVIELATQGSKADASAFADFDGEGFTVDEDSVVGDNAEGSTEATEDQFAL